MRKFGKFIIAIDAFFSPVANSRSGEVNRHEWGRIVKASFAAAVVSFVTMIATELRDRPEAISGNPIVSACVTGLSTCVLSYLHRKQDSSTIPPP